VTRVHKSHEHISLVKGKKQASTQLLFSFRKTKLILKRHHPMNLEEKLMLY